MTNFLKLVMGRMPVGSTNAGLGRTTLAFIGESIEGTTELAFLFFLLKEEIDGKEKRRIFVKSVF